MAKRLISIVLILSVIIFIFMLIGTGDPVQLNYFDPYMELMPDLTIQNVPNGCQNMVYEVSIYQPTERFYYCRNFDENARSITVSLQNDVISYVSFRPINLRYGDLIGIFGQPTQINYSYNHRISSIYFGEVYVIIADKRPPINYTTRVVAIGFLSDPFRRNR